jgi:hypothetical protein
MDQSSPVLLIVFGAGASYDSIPQYPPPYTDQNRPPLANELFDPRFNGLVARYHYLHPLISRLREAARMNIPVEEELEAINLEVARDEDTIRELLSVQSYLRDVVHGTTTAWIEKYAFVTNHAALLRNVRQEARTLGFAVNFVTFNYDTILERAASDSLQLAFTSFPSYVDNPAYKLFKLHGSVDWLRLANHVSADLWSLAEHKTMPSEDRVEPSELTWEDRFARRRMEDEDFPRMEHGSALFPAIAVPTLTKSAFECPAHHIEVLTQVLPRVTHLLVVGWRAKDQHFLDLWKAHPPANLERIYIVEAGQEEAVQVTQNLANLGGIASENTEHAIEGFTRFVHERERLQQFLSS